MAYTPTPETVAALAALAKAAQELAHAARKIADSVQAVALGVLPRRKPDQHH